MVLERVIITDLQKVSGHIERKVAAVGMSNLLIDRVLICDDPTDALLCSALVAFFELPQDETISPEGVFVPDVEENSSYQAAYSQLVCARRANKDPLGGKFFSVQIRLMYNQSQIIKNQS